MPDGEDILTAAVEGETHEGLEVRDRESLPGHFGGLTDDYDMRPVLG